MTSFERRVRRSTSCSCQEEEEEEQRKEEAHHKDEVDESVVMSGDASVYSLTECIDVVRTHARTLA